MITAKDFIELLVLLDDQGREDVSWASGLQAPMTADEFALESIFVIANSGMRYTVARDIYTKVRAVIIEGGSAHSVFGHEGKAGAMDAIWSRRNELFGQYCDLQDDEARLEFIGTLPWIGKITRFHLAKNFGLVHLCKPDVHLQRLADLEGVTPQQMCERISAELKVAGQNACSIAVVDTILWRACATGVLNSHTGEIVREAA